MIRLLAQHDHLPDYKVSLEHDMVQKCVIRSSTRKPITMPGWLHPATTFITLSRNGAIDGLRAECLSWASHERHSWPSARNAIR